MTLDPHSLTAAYALDALSETERAQMERHMRDCDECRREVDELRETAALLTAGVALAPPPGLGDRLLAAVAETPQLSPQRRPDRIRTFLAAVAAALALAVVGLGLVTGDLRERLEAITRDAAAPDAVTAILAAPDARMVEVALENGGAARVVYSRTRDEAMAFGAQLPELGRSETYELWLIHDGTPVAAGALSPSTDSSAAVRLQAPVQGAEQVAVTVERGGAGEQPAGPVIGSAEL